MPIKRNNHPRKNLFLIISISLLSLMFRPALAMDWPATGKLFVHQLGDDFVIQATSPFTSSRNCWLWWGAAVTGTGCLMLADDHLNNRVWDLKEDHSWINAASPMVTELGGTYGIAGCGLFALYSLAFRDGHAQEASFLLLEAGITSGVWVQVGKLLFGRERPSAANKYGHTADETWHGVVGRLQNKNHWSVTSYDAFPSGHTATAFAIATVLAREYPKANVVPVIAYTMATVVGITRLTEHAHWASDVFLGGCLGYLCGSQVVSHYRAEQKSGQDKNKLLFNYMVFSVSAPGLVASINF
jgi:membrane-associated phospholipid phosphatase